jgi:glycosyltransferase involved in cell wall biosynthesis
MDGFIALDPNEAIENKSIVDILQLTPGAGTMYCGNCVRDNALVAALRTLGHQVLMVPLYLPLTLDEADQSAGTPIFFGGINVYLEQKSALFRKEPRWLHHLLDSPSLLKWAAGRAGNTRAEHLGALTLSMVRGEAGNQARELEDLITWLKTQPKPDVIFLSNALLVGMTRQLKRDLDRPIVCMLQGEDYFLDSLSEPHRAACWSTLAERSKDVDLFIAPSRYFAELMRGRLGLAPERVRVVYNGISLDGYPGENGAVGKPVDGKAISPQREAKGPPVLGFFARMCREKGLDTLVEAFITLRKRQRVAGLRLCVAGSLGPADERLVNSLRERLAAAGLANEAQFHPNVDRATKLALLESFSVFSVPARYGEAFGLYVIEALAAGVPVVQPHTAAFPELVELTGGGILYEPGNAEALVEAIEGVLLEPGRSQALGTAGKRAIFEKLSAEAMARNIVEAVRENAETLKTLKS